MTAIPEILDVVAPDTEPTAEAAAPAPVLITEQQVALSTAAAVPARSMRPRQGAEAASAVRPTRRSYPKQYGFLERACMAREMARL